MRSLLLALPFILFSCSLPFRPAPDTKSLFPITLNGKIGFIDSIGKVVIVPRFYAAGEFSEGLAPVRESGLYGFIDPGGRYTIQPQYEYATPFREGLAIVYGNGVPYYIDRTGRKAFDHHFEELAPFQNGRALVMTATHKFGVIGKEGELFLDTIFARIDPFKDGLAVVEGVSEKALPGRHQVYNIGVIDTLGHFVVPFGKCTEIWYNDNGYLLASLPPEPGDTSPGHMTAKTAIIDRRGRTCVSIDAKQRNVIVGNAHNGIMQMALFKPDSVSEYASTEGVSYKGYMNLQGKIFVNDLQVSDVKDFSDNRGFLKRVHEDYSIINTRGEYIARNRFTGVGEEGFRNGVAFVEVQFEWGLIDTDANFLIKPRFHMLDEAGLRDNRYFFFSEYAGTFDNPDKRITGIALKTGQIVIGPVMEEYDRKGFRNGLLKCVIGGKQVYLNEQGKKVWSDSTPVSKLLTDVNTDYMQPGSFYAASHVPDKGSPGGWGKSDNFPHQIAGRKGLDPGQLIVTVYPDSMDTVPVHHGGLRVEVLNTMNRPVEFCASDSRLNMVVQARNKQGQWQDIEYLSGSSCGNSYHTVTLPVGTYWHFTTPRYTGAFKTMLRVALTCIDPRRPASGKGTRDEKTVYSNEYPGSVNAAQFWRKPVYASNNIMDPYQIIPGGTE